LHIFRLTNYFDLATEFGRFTHKNCITAHAVIDKPSAQATSGISRRFGLVTLSEISCLNNFCWFSLNNERSLGLDHQERIVKYNRLTCTLVLFQPFKKSATTVINQ